MPHYFWEGKDINGRPVEGAVCCDHKDGLLAELGKKNVFNVKVNRISANQLQIPLNFELLHFFITQLHRLLDSGVGLVDSFSFLIRYHSDPFFGYLLSSIRQNLNEGNSVSQAFDKYKKCFPSILVFLLEVAEKSDRLPEVMKELVDFINFRHKIIIQRRKMMSYPLTVTSIAVVLFFGVLIFVVPMFERMFKMLGDDLPWNTILLLEMSNSIRFSPYYWLGGVLIIICFGQYLPILWNKSGFYRIIPGIAGMEKDINLMFYARSLEITLHAGIRLNEALDLSESFFPEYKRKKIKEVHHQIIEGQSLMDAYELSNLFPSIFVHLIALGESSGYLAPAFERVAMLFQERVEKRMNRLNSFIEPTIMLLLSIAILFVLISIYLPIFSLGEAIG